MSSRPRPVAAPRPDVAADEPGAAAVASAAPPAGMVEVHGVSKFFGDVVAVSDVTFAVRAGVTALLGPNGAGKSTLFRMMCGLTPAIAGNGARAGSRCPQ